jgi:hypothetical protein
MAVTPLDRLKSQLLSSGIQQENIALFQIINQLIDYLRITTFNIKAISGSSGSGGLGSTFLTKNKESGLPSSLQVLAGSGIQFNDTQGKRVISAAIPFGIDSNEPGEEGLPGNPGGIGPRGLQGIQGMMGIPGLDSDYNEYEIPLLIPNMINFTFISGGLTLFPGGIVSNNYFKSTTFVLGESVSTYGAKIARFSADVSYIGIPGSTVTQRFAIIKADGTSVIDIYGDASVDFAGTIKVAGLPTVAGAVGTLWVDTTGGLNIVKRV